MTVPSSSSSPPPAPPRLLRSLVTELDRMLTGCRTVLEVGCGAGSPLQFLAGKYQMEGLDIHEPWLQTAKAKGFLQRYHLGSALDIDQLFAPASFDAVVALDLIEHLQKPDGFQLIEKMSRVARRGIVVFTPNGFLPQDGGDNPWNRHVSGWELQEFTDLGFRVVGINGLKALRGEYARLRHRPRLFWGVVSELSQRLYCHRHPASAFSLLCWKDLGPAAPGNRPGL